MLCMIGTDDDAFLAEVEHLSLLAPKAELVYMAGVGHCPQIEAPMLHQEAVLSFLYRHLGDYSLLRSVAGI